MPEPSTNRGTRSGSIVGSSISDLTLSSRGMIVMACDAALRFLEAADTSRAAGKQEAAVLNVEKAQRIVLELMGALDRAVAPAMTETLERLYQTLLDRLSDAMKGDRKAISETRLVLTRLRNAWAEAGRSSATPNRGSHACEAKGLGARG